MARDRKKSKSCDVSAELERVPTRSLFRYMFFLPELVSHLNRYSNTIRGHRLICFLVGLSTFFLGLWVFDPKLSLNGDNAEFITLARSLVAGQGLQYVNLPEPIPATKYPFGFPILLLPMEWLFPGEWVPMKILVLIIFSIGIAVLYLVVRSRLEILPSLAVVFVSIACGKSWLTDVSGVNSFGPLLLHFSHQIMSEGPYLTVSLLAVWLMGHGISQSGIRRNKTLWLGIMCVIGAYYIRSAGIALIFSFFVYLLILRDTKRAFFFIAVCFVAWIPWTVRNSSVGDGAVYVQQLLMINPYYPDRGFLGISELLERIVENSLLYLNIYLPRLLWPYSYGGEEMGPESVFILMIAIYTIWKAIRSKRDIFLVIYTTCGLGIAILWPWVDMRFLIGIVPFIVYFSVRCIVDLADFFKRGGGPWTGRIFVWCLSFVVISGQLPGVMNLAVYSRLDYPPVWSGYYSAGKWLNDHASSDALVVCRKPYWMYVVSGLKSINFVFPFEDTSAVLSYLDSKNTDYIVIESLGFPQTSQYLIPTVQEHRENFDVVWSDTTKGTYVLKYLQFE